MPPDLFSESYAQARGKFIALATSAGADMATHRHPAARGPLGEALAIEVARLGPADARRWLVTLCGTHGVEAYPGSAIQLQWLAAPPALPPDTAVLLVHGLNPWGWAHDSQLNEDHCDLNRNFVDFTRLPTHNPLHPRIAQAIHIDAMSLSAADAARGRVTALRDEVGAKPFMDALLMGQYDVPTCLKYGGPAPAWSNRVLRDVVARELSNARRIFVLDWHTGLGDWGQPFELCFCAAGTEAWARTAAAWGQDVVERGQHSWIVQDEGDAPAPALSGLAENAIWDALPGVPVAGGAVEFGSWPLDTIIAAAITDHWILFDAAGQGADVRPWRQMMRTWFSPPDPQWQRSVLSHGSRLFDASLRELGAWAA